jgi:hypothetical protein
MKGKDKIWDVSDMEFPSGLLVSAHYRPDFFAAREAGVPPSKDLLTRPAGCDPARDIDLRDRSAHGNARNIAL